MKGEFDAIKKPLIVRVWCISRKEEIPLWAEENAFWGIEAFSIPEHMLNVAKVWKQNDFVVYTLEGIMMCNEGDYLIRGVKGEIYPCRRDIFLETYKVADAM